MKFILSELRTDTRLALRRAGRHWTFTMAVIICLALGIGATTGVFSVIRPVLLQPIPFDSPDRLVAVAAYNANRSDPNERYWMPWRPTEQLIRLEESLEGIAAFRQVEFDVLGSDGPERIAGAETLAGSFDVLGVQALLGRAPTVGEAVAGVRAALISEELWTRRYARDREVRGRTITINERPHEIVGVLPAGHRFPGRADIWTLYHPDDYSEAEQRGVGMLLVIGRLLPDATTTDVERDVGTTLRAVKEIDPVFYAAWGFEALPLGRYLVGDFERPLWTLLAGSLLVLLLAMANVANLLIARSHADAHDRAVKAALGGRSAVLIRERLIENGLLAMAGAAAGLLLAGWATRVLLATAAPDNPAFDRVGTSPTVAGIAVGVGVAVAVFMSIVPEVGRRRIPLWLLRGTRAGGPGPRQRRAQTLFVVGQVALSVVLLVAAGLLLKTFRNLTALDLGFDTDRVVTMRVSTPPSRAGDARQAADFARAVLERMSGIGEVTAAGAASWVPFDDPNFVFNHSVEGFPPESPNQMTLAPGWVVSPGYFSAMGIPLLRGRDFAPADRADAPLAVIVNREFERRFWPGESAVGKRIKRGTYFMDRPWMEIVGVVENSRSGLISDPVLANLYFPMEQSSTQYLTQMAYVARYRGDLEALLTAFRAAVADVSPATTVYRVSTGSDIMRAALGRPKFSGLMIGAFAAIGLALATAGVYGLTSFSVGQRTREFALRMALGARPLQVRILVLRQAVLVAVAGAALGLVVSAAVSRLLRDILFDMDAIDAPTYGLVTVVIVTTVLLASYLPAWRATSVEPSVVLRED